MALQFKDIIRNCGLPVELYGAEKAMGDVWHLGKGQGVEENKESKAFWGSRCTSSETIRGTKDEPTGRLEEETV